MRLMKSADLEIINGDEPGVRAERLAVYAAGKWDWIRVLAAAGPLGCRPSDFAAGALPIPPRVSQVPRERSPTHVSSRHGREQRSALRTFSDSNFSDRRREPRFNLLKAVRRIAAADKASASVVYASVAHCVGAASRTTA